MVDNTEDILGPRECTHARLLKYGNPKGYYVGHPLFFYGFFKCPL